MTTNSLQTQREGFYSITAAAKDAVRQSGVADGICVVYCPHTTAGITINENADPDVVRDMLLGLDRHSPTAQGSVTARGTPPRISKQVV